MLSGTIRMFKTCSSVFIHRGNLNNSQRVSIRYPLNVCLGHTSNAMHSVFTLFSSFGLRFSFGFAFRFIRRFFLGCICKKHKRLQRGENRDGLIITAKLASSRNYISQGRGTTRSPPPPRDRWHSFLSSPVER